VLELRLVLEQRQRLRVEAHGVNEDQGQAAADDRKEVRSRRTSGLGGRSCRIGGGALISGNAVITEDVPPDALAHGRNLIAGLNLVGLRRRAVAAPAVAELKRAYHAVYATAGACPALAQAALTGGDYQTPEARAFLDFFLGGKRGRFISPA
jgi:hypothetical protein